MKLIIDIPDICYDACKDWEIHGVATLAERIIANGTPYEEQTTDEKAEWIYCGVWSEGVGMGQIYGDKVKCSNCMTEYRFTHRFCPYCGRRMKNGKL